MRWILGAIGGGIALVAAVTAVSADGRCDGSPGHYEGAAHANAHHDRAYRGVKDGIGCNGVRQKVSTPVTDSEPQTSTDSVTSRAANLNRPRATNLNRAADINLQHKL